MKRLYSLFLALVLCIGCAVNVQALDDSRSYLFELSVDGSDTKQVQPGDIITVVFQLIRTDMAEGYEMYAVQNEINYDTSFFELVEGSALLGKGITSTDLPLRDTTRSFYMNFVSLTGGEPWNAKTLVGSFQLKVIGQSGSSKITCQNYLVSTKDGQDSFAAQAQDVTAIISADCLVQFETNGGSKLPPVTVPSGSKLQKPEDPVKNGYTLSGWYRDIDLQEEWDFDRDVVESNMTLYAKWTEGQPGVVDTSRHFPWWLIVIGVVLAMLLCLWGLFAGKKSVRFETDGGEKIKTQWVKTHGLAAMPAAPIWAGHTFMGWYTDQEKTKRWNFDADKVEENMVLYAKWL